MSGVIFIVGIPTEIEEEELKNEFSNPKIEIVGENNKESIIILEKSNVFNFKKDDKEYQKFSQALPLTPPTAPQLEQKKEFDSISINIPEPQSISDTNLKVPTTTLKKTRSCNDLSDNENVSKQYKFNEQSTAVIGVEDNHSAKLDSILKNSNREKSEVPIGINEKYALDIPVDSSMEFIMNELINKMKIKNASWKKSKNEKFYQILFSIEIGLRQERILTLFEEWGIGERNGSFVSMINCAIYNKPNKDVYEANVLNDEENESIASGAWNKFLNSVRARLNVAQIVDEVKQDATLTFDFVSLLTIAGILAAFGLVEDSTIFLASSMLISPLMGPIIATIFGTVIKDKKLVKLGFINEMFGIGIAVIVGYLFGFIICTIDISFGNGDGITNEMLSRCETHSLIIGIFTAIPSGAAAAIAILGENIGSLVGVAISASLLPPAVNAGIFWALATLYGINENNTIRYNVVIRTTNYSTNQGIELLILGAMSMLLTIINVICIYFTGILILKIKEVAPIKSKINRQFWKHDIKVARDFNKTHLNDNEKMIDLTLTEADIAGNTNADRLSFEADILRTLNHPMYQNTWSPTTSRHNFLNRRQSILYNNASKDNTSGHPLFDNHQFRRHMSLYGAGSSKTIVGKCWSPPKYKSILEEPLQQQTQMFNKIRRASVAYFNNENRISNCTDDVSVPSTSNQGKKIPTRTTSLYNNKIMKNLQKISEIKELAESSSNESLRRSSTLIKRQDSKKLGKFTVTPAEQNQ